MTPPLSPELMQIAKLLDRSRPQVVVFVGTGVAMNATGQPHASWLGLLKHGVRHLVLGERFTPKYGDELTASLSAAFSPFQLQAALQHAETVEQVLNTPDEKAFAQWLQSAFTDFKTLSDEKAKAPLEALRDLHEAGALLLTTNYDSLLSDITGSPPVTWEEHADFHRVMTRQKPGILHIHGHWQRPSSIVLGRSSYDRVVADVQLQQLFRTLWLDWSWVYVGCGDGLDDPNLGRLLEWSKAWGESGLPDFFLARDEKAGEIAARPAKPPNLSAIGYPTYADLPVMLRSVTPAARCSPFVRVDDTFPLFHLPGASDPFPSRQEYLDDDVPTFAADAELQTRLQTHRWACCIDVASVGKTTLALRAATTHEQRVHPVFYLDLKREIEDDPDTSPVRAVSRLARPGTLLILDNIHYQPELAHQLWQQWHAKPSDSRGRLLLVATRIHQPVVSTPEHDLTFFERHPSNPAILLQPTAEDLGRLAKRLYRRVGGPKCPPMPEPPATALAEWHQNYRAALNAFMFAVLDSLAEFQKGRWALPPSRASAWVRAHWLGKLDAQELENVVCLAVFGAQELEMLVQDEALPHPGKTDTLFELGLVAQTKRGQLKQYRQFELREPGWGRLILAALTPAIDEERILFGVASKHLRTALVLSSRLHRDKDNVRLRRLWEYLALRADELVIQIWDLPLPYFSSLVRSAKAGGQVELVARFWKAIEAEPQAFASLALDNQLNFIASFLEVAKQHGCEIVPLWNAIESRPDKLIASAWETPLGEIGVFFDVAKQHGRDTARLWNAIENQPDKFAAIAWDTNLHFVAPFLNMAKQHGRDTASLWEAIESKPDKFAAIVWTISLDRVGSFLSVAKQHGRDTNPLWDAIESQPAKLIASAWETPLGVLGSFLDVARQQGRDTTQLWDAIDNQLDKLATSAWATSLDQVASYLNVAKQHGRDTTPLWQVLESQPDKLAVSALETSLGGVSSFLDVAKQHGRDTAPLWEAIESKIEKLAASAWKTPLEKVGSFLNVAKQNGRDTAPLWQMLERRPDKLAANARETSLEHVANFMKVAKAHERDTMPLWDAILGKVGEPNRKTSLDRVAACASRTSLDGIGAFLEIAKQQGCDTVQVWNAIFGESAIPDQNPTLANIAPSAWGTPVGKIGSFLNVAKKHGQNVEALCQIFECDPDRFSQKCKDSPLSEMAGFSHYAPPGLFEIALRKVKPGHWNKIPHSQGMVGATWLASHCSEVNRDDLASDLLKLLLRRANWRDFPPQIGGFAQVCWLLANVPASAVGLVGAFIHAVCNEIWLKIAYSATSCGQLASGLWQLALRQSVERCRQFHSKQLDWRLKKELSQFEQSMPSDQAQIIQFLGCAVLCGRDVSLRSLDGITSGTLLQLPLSILPHRQETANVEELQVKLWLGLRAFVSIKQKRLPLPRETIEETLGRWRVNLAETSSSPATTAHRVNRSMVTWLEVCAHTNLPSLLPAQEPLWTLAGFPYRLALPNSSSY